MEELSISNLEGLAFNKKKVSVKPGAAGLTEDEHKQENAHVGV